MYNSDTNIIKETNVIKQMLSWSKTHLSEVVDAKIVAEVDTVAELYLLWESEERRKHKAHTETMTWSSMFFLPLCVLHLSSSNVGSSSMLIGYRG
jgi:hypothetical protein